MNNFENRLKSITASVSDEEQEYATASAILRYRGKQRSLRARLDREYEADKGNAEGITSLSSYADKPKQGYSPAKLERFESVDMARKKDQKLFHVSMLQ